MNYFPIMGGYWLYAAAILVAALLFGFWVFFKKRQKGESFKQSLELVLFSVRIPNRTAEEIQQAGKQEKDCTKVMEGFYSNLISLKPNWFLGARPWVTLEIAKVGGEVCFFVSAPAKYAGFFEKRITSIYPEAEVDECDDFSIFNKNETVTCGYALTTRPAFLPLKTYNSIDTDSLSAVTNVLTKMASDEEAALQISIRNSSTSWRERGTAVLTELSKGKSYYEAMRRTGIFAGGESETEKQKQAQSPMQTPKLDEELVKAVGDKLNQHSFETNIRIMVSIGDKMRSEEVFGQLSDALDQFSAPKLNSLNVTKAKGGKAKKIIYDFIFRNFDSGIKSILSTEELASIYHFPTPFLKTPNVRNLQAKAAPAPAYLPAEGLLLGYNQYRGEKKDVRLGIDDRRRHLYVVGQTGTGKSAFLSNLIEQDVLAGVGVGVLDPHGDLVDDILGKIPNERLDDVVVFDPGNLERSIGLNMLEYDPKFPEQKTFIINEFIKIFDKLYDLKTTGGPMFEQYTRNSLMLLMDDPAETYTLMEVPKVLADKEFRHYLLAKCRNILVREFWEKQAEQAGGEASLKNIVPYITSKFDTFISNDYMRPIIGQAKSTFKFRDIIDGNKILLVNLSKGRLGEINSSLLGLIITSKLTIAAFSRVDTAEKDRKDFYLYLDEFQNFATDTISTILSEARKYKLCLTISHQFIGQLEDEIRDSVFGNIGTMSVFRVGVEDAEFLQKQFTPVFNAQDLIKIENYSAYLRLMVNGMISTPFNIKTYPPNPSDRERMADIKEYYILKNGRAREEIEAEVEARRRTYASGGAAKS
jgi:hypothetical protein